MKKIIYILFIVFTLFGIFHSTTTAAGFTPNSSDVAKIGNFSDLFRNIIGIVGVLFGFGFFAMMIMGGVRYLLSAGDPKALQSAKGTITWAIIGLAILALSYTILVIISAFTGVDVTRFRIINF